MQQKCKLIPYTLDKDWNFKARNLYGLIVGTGRVKSKTALKEYWQTYKQY
jgi:hypothetical protein